MKQSYTALIIMTLLLALGACTPRPEAADGAAEAFLNAMSSHEDNQAADYTDNPSEAEDSLQRTWDALQAEGLRTQLKNVDTTGEVATAHYELNWALPHDRHFKYDAEMTLTKTGSQWSVRWQPTIIHPKLGSDQHLELRRVVPETADVVGSDGTVLLTPGSAWRIFLDTKTLKENNALESTIRDVVRTLDAMRVTYPQVPRVNADSVIKEAKEVTGEYSLALLPDQAAPTFQNFIGNKEGIRLNKESVLLPPDPQFAPDIIRRISRIVEPELSGTPGWNVVTVNSTGSAVTEVAHHKAEPAPALEISLNKGIQDAAQEAVDTRADSKTMMVVIQPSTGAILAVAQTAKADEDGDVALNGQYPPGSTFKIISAMAGMQKEGLTPGSPVGCPGTQDIGHRVVTNYNDFSLGGTTLDTAFARSCNTTFAAISDRLQPGELQKTAQQFGLGRDYSIEGLTTITGSVPEGQERVDRVEAGFGQGKDLASPFGMALVAATAAAGTTPIPYLINSDKHRTQSTDQSPSALDPEHINSLQSMMRSVVTQGTATAISDAGEVYGKTGEAEIANGSHSWFAGYRGDLAFATLVVYGGGSEHAVGVTKKFFEQLDDSEGLDTTQE